MKTEAKILEIEVKGTSMNDANTFSEYRQSSLPYQPAQEQASFPSSRHGKGLPQEAQIQQQQRPPHTQQRKVSARMPKAQALVLLRKMKRGIVIASFLGFGTFSALAMGHTVGATAQLATTTKTTTQTARPAATATKKTTTTTATATPATTTTQQGGGGYGFGSSNSTSTPVSGTHTS
ncbi:MAG: hypothetical protein NVS4B12_05270 [Ktedonobacteraceae bacterium]